ncbi:MAG: hypothetical protein Q7U30_01560, partial [Methylicorpusculum sp.]|nr:hypothetical protein [Methylicorpusculum sp.]
CFLIAQFCAKHGWIVDERGSVLCAIVGWAVHARYRPKVAHPFQKLNASSFPESGLTLKSISRKSKRPIRNSFSLAYAELSRICMSAEFNPALKLLSCLTVSIIFLKDSTT